MNKKFSFKNKNRKVLLSMLLIGCLMAGSNAWGQAYLINENIQSWTNRTSYGNYTQTIPAGTVSMTQCMVSNNAAATGTCSAGRVQMNSSSGIIELPEIASCGVAEFHMVAGGAGRTVKLQKYNGASWVDITTFTGIGTAGATFSYDVNLSSATKLRLSSPSSALYVHDIIITDYVPSCTTASTVTLNDRGTITTMSQTLCTDALTLPTLSSPCADWTFVGWSETQNGSTFVPNPYTPTDNITLFAVYRKIEGVSVELFSDNFSDFTTVSSQSSRTGWESLSNIYGVANGMCRLGAGSTLGSITKSTMLSIVGTQNLTLTFKAMRWNNDVCDLSLSISGGGTLSQASITTLGSSGTETTNPVFGENDSYTVTITGATNTTKITFESSTSGQRIFLDDVVITYGTTTTYSSNPDCVVCETPPTLGSIGALGGDESAYITSDIANEGDCPVSARGFLYSETDGDFKLGDHGVTDVPVALTGDFEALIENLDCGTTYYVRAYATNGAGTSYSAVETFDTDNCPPEITANPTLTFGPVDLAVATNDMKQLVVTGTNLTANISYSITGTNAGFFSPATGTLSTSGGNLEITYTPTVAGNHSATLTLTSGTATPVTVTLSGSATVECNIAAPVASEASSQTPTSFTANWSEVDNASGYELIVYTKEGEETQIPNSVVANWTFPTSVITDLTPDLASANNLTQVLSTNVGAIYNLDASSYGGTTNSRAVTGWNGGAGSKYWTVTVNTTGFTDLTISSKQRGSNTGPKNFKIQYNVGDGIWSDVVGATIIVTSDNKFVSSGIFSLPPACNNRGTLSIRWLMIDEVSVNGSAVVAAGSNAIDDILITGTTKVSSVSKIPISGYNPKVITDGNVTSYEVTGLTSGVTYYYVVKAIGEGLCSSETSDESNEIAVTLPCPAPEIVYTTPVDPFGTTMPIMAEVNDECGISKYGFVYAKAPNNAPTIETSTVVECDDLENNFFSSIITGLDCGTTYYFRAFAINTTGTAYSKIEQVDGGVASFDTEPCFTCIPPTANPAINVTENSFTANWENNGASEYTLNVYTKEIKAINETEHFSNLVFTDAPLDIDKKIEYGSSTLLNGWSFYINPAASPQGYFTGGNYGSAPQSLSFSRTGQYVQTALYNAPITTFSLWGFEEGGCTTSLSMLHIEGSTDGVLWNTIDDLSIDNFRFATTSHLFDLSDLGYRQVKISYTKDKCNLAIDDIHVITEPTEVNVMLSGYPKTLSGTSDVVTNLTSEGTYYYTVQTGDNCVSQEIEVKLPLAIFDAGNAVGNWTLASSALENSTKNDFTFGAASAAFKRMKKPASEGMNYTWETIPTSDLPSGQGFAYQVNPAIVTSSQWLEHNGQRWFNSPRVANTGEVVVTVEEGVKYALVGNPYYKDIDLSHFEGTNLSTEGYYTTNAAGDVFPLVIEDLTIHTWEGIIASTSAEAQENGQKLGDITIYEEAPAPVPAFTPAVSNGKMNVTAINDNGSSTAYINNKSTGTSIAGSHDMPFLNMGENQTVQVYTSKNNESGQGVKLALNTINDDVTTVPVGLFTNYEGNVSLSFSGMDTYSCDITLLDYLTGAEVNLTGLSAYQYPISVSGNTSGRFALYFGSRVPTSDNQLDNVNVQAFVRNGKINIVSNSDLQNVKICSVSGSQIANLTISGKSYIVNNILPAGVYLVTVQTSNGILTQKVLLQ
ncbi:MAG: T9SS type A sorting domain-containing protein [Paludibacter sp.]|nr:T9SS type A sorting domain-containing protein [Paludibacter sp.]